MIRRLPWLLATGALVAALSIVSGAAASPSTVGHQHAAKAGGTLVFGSEQEPPCLNQNLNDCNNTWTNYYAELVLRGVYIVNPKFVYTNDLASKISLQLNPQRVTYTINPKANWSDGKPVTAQDMKFTLQTIMNKTWDSKPNGGGIVSRNGYDQIAKTTIVNSKTVTFTFKTNFADWKDLFGTVLPQHALAGVDFSTAFINDINNPKTGQPISDGPFLFTQWNHGSDFTLVKNPKFYGAKAKLDKIVARFLTNSNSEIQAVRGGEVDAIYPQPQLPLADLKSVAGLTVQSHLGPIYEHIDIEVGPKGNPLAKFPWVRQALMLSINRSALVNAVFSTLNPSLKPLGNVIYLNNQPQYVDHFKAWNYDAAKAQKLIESHGCTKGGDGIYSCAGTRLSFQFESTAGNQLRTLAFSVIQQQLKANGIEVINNFKPSNIYFGDDLPNGNYDLAMFAWSGGVDPSPNTSIWSCPSDGGTQNYMNYCNKAVDAAFKKGNAELDPAKRTAYYNQADALIARDIPTIPLYQKPTFLVFHSTVGGMSDNTTQAGPMWNAENWTINK
ncbi:MAG: peptide ABC transporter substrate-binding protein [Gaiellaceae bacterium]